MIVAFSVPYRLALGLKDSKKYNVVETCTTVSFAIDIILCFFTETFYEEEYVTVSDHR